MRNPNLLSRAGMTVAAAALVMTGACSNDDKDPTSTPATTTTTAPPTERERLDDLLDFDDLQGPTAVTWEACPEDGEALGPRMRVNGPNWGEMTAPINEATYAEISEVHRYRDESGNIIGWCGKSIGSVASWNVVGPRAGTVMVIPATAGCPLPQPGEQFARGCEDMPIEYELPEEPSHGPEEPFNPLPPSLPEGEWV